MPRSWTEDPDRCRSAGIPDDLAVASKPRLAARMVERALDAGTPARRVAGDEVYGDNRHLRTALEHRRTGYVLAVSSTHDRELRLELLTSPLCFVRPYATEEHVRQQGEQQDDSED